MTDNKTDYYLDDGTARPKWHPLPNSLGGSAHDLAAIEQVEALKVQRGPTWWERIKGNLWFYNGS